MTDKDRTALDAAVQKAGNLVLIDAFLPAARLAARNCGYALAVHGSLARDIDLIAVPWRVGAMDADYLANNVRGAILGVVGNCLFQGDGWTKKPHGRLARTLTVYVGESYRQLDLSVMPRLDEVPEEKIHDAQA